MGRRLRVLRRLGHVLAVQHPMHVPVPTPSFAAIARMDSPFAFSRSILLTPPNWVSRGRGASSSPPNIRGTAGGCWRFHLNQQHDPDRYVGIAAGAIFLPVESI
jgi:hypothetical protein